MISPGMRRAAVAVRRFSSVPVGAVVPDCVVVPVGGVAPDSAGVPDSAVAPDGEEPGRRGTAGTKPGGCAWREGRMAAGSDAVAWSARRERCVLLLGGNISSDLLYMIKFCTPYGVQKSRCEYCSISVGRSAGP